MKEWHVESGTNFYTLLTDDITLLKGSFGDWKDVLSDLDTFFSNRSSEISIKENQTFVPKNDYHFSILSFSDQLSSNDQQKALEHISLAFFSRLKLSPFYTQLVESWEELVEEVELLSNDTSVSPVPFMLQSFNSDHVKKGLVSALNQKNMSALDRLLLDIKLIEYTTRNKRTIIALVYPENHLTSSELKTLDDYLQSSSSHALYFIFSKHSFTGVQNLRYKEKVINQLLCWDAREDLKEQLPFEWNENYFFEACNWYMKLVDIYQFETVFLSLQTVDNLILFVYVYSLFLLTNTPVIVDLMEIPSLYVKYFDCLIEDTL